MRRSLAKAMAALMLVPGAGMLAACGPTRVSETPPTVSYQVTGHDVAQAGANAQQYCSRFGTSAQFQGFQQTASGNTAVYTCE